MTKLAIIHFHAIEHFPPVLNLVNYLAGKSGLALEVRVYTMLDHQTQERFQSTTATIRILRMGELNKHKKGWKRSLRPLQYGRFYTSVLTNLTRWKPQVILYYETLSSFPTYIYKRFINKTSALMIHYHEYTSPEEYEMGMKLSRWLHVLEKSLYPANHWLSHTNAERMEKFLADNSGISIPNTHVLPNFPPMSWKVKVKPAPAQEVTKMVYAGAFSLDTMYVKELANWVLKQEGKLVWHIYSGNIDPEAESYIEDLKTEFIAFKGYKNYFCLPEILKQYQVGVILYKGHIPNYVYNAPNKLFEYLACGLDVWFPDVMKSSLPYQTQNSFPKVVAMDFNNLEQMELSSLVNKSGLNYHPSVYFCEITFAPLAEAVVSVFRDSTGSGLPEQRQ